jgi:hypothetical protein
MSDNDQPKQPRSLVSVWLIVGALLLPILYTLSMGPMLWLATHGYLPQAARQFLSDFYAPLWIAGGYVPFLKQFLYWYAGFWG